MLIQLLLLYVFLGWRRRIPPISGTAAVRMSVEITTMYIITVTVLMWGGHVVAERKLIQKIIMCRLRPLLTATLLGGIYATFIY